MSSRPINCPSCGRRGCWKRTTCQRCLGPVRRQRLNGRTHDGVASPARLDALAALAAKNLALFPQRRRDR